MKRLIIAFALLGMLVTTVTACHPRMARHMLGAAVMTAAIVGTAHMLHHYDVEYHRRHCYQTRRWHDGRWVYRCRGQWVYYDPACDCWYAYR